MRVSPHTAPLLPKSFDLELIDQAANSEAALLIALDLWNQAPLAGQDFVRLLPTPDPTPQQIIEARAQSFIEPATGTPNAPGLGNSMPNVREDQKRRTDANLSVLQLLKRH